MDEDKKKGKKWKKKKGQDDGGADLRLHRAETDHDLKKLLVKVEDHNALDMNGDAPVHSYIRRRDKGKFKCLMTLLIHSECDVNLPNKDGQTALHLACEANDINFVKALIAFDAKINSINNSYQTALDIVLRTHHNPDIMLLLEQLGGGTYSDMFYSDDDNDSGRVSPFTEVDMEGQQLKDSHIYRPRSLHHHHITVNGYGGWNDGVDGGTNKSPSPSYQRLSPVGQLPSLQEEDEDDLVFKTARQFPSIEASSTPDRQSPVPTQDETDSIAERQSPISTQEADAELGSKTVASEDNYYPISPNESIEMALTRDSVIRLQQLRLIESTDLLEDSVSSVSSTSVLEKTAFFLDSIPLARTLGPQGPASLPLVEASHGGDSISVRETMMAQAYGELYSPKVGRVGPGFGVLSEETDAAESLEQPQRLTDSASPEAQTSSDQLRHEDHAQRQHVHFDDHIEKVEKDNQLHLPLKYGEEGKTKEKRRRRKAAFLRQPSSSNGPMRSFSIYNPEMEVLTSIIGYSVVHRTSEKLGGQRVLCLDGGGVKGLIQIEMLKTIEQMTGKSISDLFDWVVGTSTGGILALGMIYGGLSLAELRRVYFEMKDTVFKQQSKFISHTCDTNALESLLKRMLGTEKRMDDITKPNVLISAVEKTTTRLPLVFFNNCFEDDKKKSIRNEFVWKVARYTSAAPVFFAECDNYVDGGVVANDPTTFALPEIQEFLTKKHGYKSPAAKISCVVSLGCGIYPPEPLGNTDIADALKITKLLSAPRRLGDLLTLLTTALGGSEDMARLCRINCEQQGISYFRFSPEIGEDVGTTEKDNHKLCEIIIRAKALFVDNSEQVKEMIRVLGCNVQDQDLYCV